MWKFKLWERRKRKFIESLLFRCARVLLLLNDCKDFSPKTLGFWVLGSQYVRYLDDPAIVDPLCLSVMEREKRGVYGRGR